MSPRPRVVCDTNVLVSAFIAGGPPSRVIEAAINGRVELVLAEPVIRELDRVLTVKLGFERERLEEITTLLDELASSRVVEPTTTPDPVTGDAADDVILACAVDAGVAMLVSGDRKHLLPIGEHRGVRIVTPQELLAELSARPSSSYAITTVTATDLDDLLPLMRAYCDFYDTAPSDGALLGLSRAALADPTLEGVQLIARDAQLQAVGFASVFWSWDTTEGTRIGIMNDLYVAPQARGTGIADELIAACLERCRERGASRLEWQTGSDNERAQAVYERVGGRREPWLVYIKEVDRR